VILLIFGAKRIPELARSLGKASYEFKKAKEEILKETEELKNAGENHAAAQDPASAGKTEQKKESE